ncbi:MAG: cobaltochelatase subunit CobN [Acidobacteriota bacterium]|nr:cobaltochelatase subunit CobN [Acidobacteriota bacterium]
MNITVVSVYPEALRAFISASGWLDAEYPGWGSLQLFNANQVPDETELARLATAVRATQAIIVDLMGADPRWSQALIDGLHGYTGQLIAVGAALVERARLGEFNMATSGSMGASMGAPSGPPSMPPQGMGMMATMGTRPGMAAAAGSGRPDRAAADAVCYSQLVRAFLAMTRDDARFILATLLHDHGGYPQIVIPQASRLPEGVFPADPTTRTRYASVSDYLATHGAPGDRQVIALLYYGRPYPNDTEPLAAGLARALSQIGWVLPVAVNMEAAAAIEPLRGLFATPGLAPDLIVNLMSFRLGAGPMGGDALAGEALLVELGAPYLKPLSLPKRTAAEWRESPNGLGPSEVLVSIMLPELDGCIDEVPIAAISPAEPDAAFQISSGRLELIDEQVKRLVERAAGLLRLREKPNAAKRVAIVGYDYPAGEANLLGGSFLDVAASIEAILGELAASGYQVSAPAPGRLLNDLLARAVNSPSYLPTQAPVCYRRSDALAALDNPAAWAEVDARWPDDGRLPMVNADGDYLIPVVDYGNVLVGIQPGRGPLSHDSGSGNHDDASHDNTTPPHPQYLAFYTWLRTVWQADVIVHVGTHGTFEFLKSKENAVSASCYPDLMLADLPHVYLYYAGNPSEALIARRRSHACLVSYQPPVLRASGLHDELAELSGLLGEYRRSLDMAPQTADDLLDDLAARAQAAHLPADPGELEAELERMGGSLVPLGLHVFGTHWDADEVALMVQAVVSHGLDGMAAAGEIMASARGLEPGAFDRLPSKVRAELDQSADDLVARSLAEPNRSAAELAAGNPKLTGLVERCRELARRFASNDEWAGLHNALSGRHVAARLGGDVTRNPEVLPSGGSLYQFDPRQVPSALADRRGAEIAAEVVTAYQAGNGGAMPSCVGVVLWGLETSRTHGESYAQIMSLLGVRRTSSRRPGQPRWEVIPAEELTRPRVDVVVTICGFFRDLFGTLIEELDDVFAEVAGLDEPAEINPIAARARTTRAALIADGAPPAEAAELACARIFGPAPELYGTGLTDIIEAGRWESADELADSFRLATQHIYGRRRHGTPGKHIYLERLASVEAVSQTRSSNEYEITDLDHYFEFLGGLTASVNAARGSAVPTLVTDTTGRRVHTASAADAARSGLYTRLLNPSWIEAMLAHGHRGVTEIADRTTNLLGLAATTGQLDDWMFSAVHDRFIADLEMRQRLTEANPHATAGLASRLSEADRRGLWHPTDERRQQLAELQFDIDSELEGAGEPTGAHTQEETRR